MAEEKSIVCKSCYELFVEKEGLPINRYDWQEGSIVVPPELWFHQHFNASATPARYLALRWGSRKNPFLTEFKTDESVKEGGDQI